MFYFAPLIRVAIYYFNVHRYFQTDIICPGDFAKYSRRNAVLETSSYCVNRIFCREKRVIYPAYIKKVLMASRTDLMASRTDLMASRTDLMALETNLMALETNLMAAKEKDLSFVTISYYYQESIIHKRFYFTEVEILKYEYEKFNNINDMLTFRFCVGNTYLKINYDYHYALSLRFYYNTIYSAEELHEFKEIMKRVIDRVKPRIFSIN